MKNGYTTVLLALMLIGLIGNASAGALSCSFVSESPTNGSSSVSDTTPNLKITPRCNNATVDLTVYLSDGTSYSDNGRANNTEGTVTSSNKLDYGTVYYWNVTASTQDGGSTVDSGDYNFELSQFGSAGNTINAVTNDLIDPIANLVLGLIKLFVALFVIGMIGRIFNSVGGAVGQKL